MMKSDYLILYLKGMVFPMVGKEEAAGIELVSCWGCFSQFHRSALKPNWIALYKLRSDYNGKYKR